MQALKQPNRRFAHVQYARPNAAAAALAALHQKLVSSGWGGRRCKAWAGRAVVLLQLCFGWCCSGASAELFVFQTPQHGTFGLDRRSLAYSLGCARSCIACLFRVPQVPELNKQGVLLVEYATPADDRGLGSRPSSSGSGSVPKGGTYGIGSGPGGKGNISNVPTNCIWGKAGSGRGCAGCAAVPWLWPRPRAGSVGGH